MSYQAIINDEIVVKIRRALLFLIFLFFAASLFGQVKKIENYSVNGKLKSKGRVLVCPDFEEKYPCYNSTCRKTGKWKYYYDNGNIERIEKYRNVTDCGSNEIPEGLWQYFDEKGALVKQDEYKNGIIWTSDVSEYYCNNELAGKMRVREGIRDTLEYVEWEGSNHIRNGDFNFYYGQPNRQLNNGQNQIEKQIPFWVSPDGNTPDYYNQYRGLKNVPDNIAHEYNEIYNYVGIILYHEPTVEYSEYITGELNSELLLNRRYCLKVRIRLSRNSGYFINRLGAYFTDSILPVQELLKNTKGFTHLIFNDTLDGRDEWMNLCAPFVATGKERYITIGRFGSLPEISIKSIVPFSYSEGDYNRSAYYLIDKIELIDDTAGCSFNTGKAENQPTFRINFDSANPDSLRFLMNKTIVLTNIFFDFDKSVLLPASYDELENLLKFLKINKVSVLISGHTDNIGNEDYNNELSLSRARTVSEWLITNGIDEKRIQIEGCGAGNPMLENDSEENRSLNRRVEFVILGYDP